MQINPFISLGRIMGLAYILQDNLSKWIENIMIEED